MDRGRVCSAPAHFSPAVEFAAPRRRHRPAPPRSHMPRRYLFTVFRLLVALIGCGAVPWALDAAGTVDTSTARGSIGDAVAGLEAPAECGVCLDTCYDGFSACASDCQESGDATCFAECDFACDDCRGSCGLD